MTTPQNRIRRGLLALLAGLLAFATTPAHAEALLAWGYNFSGQLGNGTNTDSNVPVAVTGLGSGVTAIASGIFHSLAIHNGATKAWGDSTYDQLGNGTNTDSTVPVPVTGLGTGVTAIASGAFHSLAIHNGDTKAWGSNGGGQLGNGTNNTSSNVPVAVTGLGSGVTAIAGGIFHSLAIHNGAAKAWGVNSDGQLGSGTNTDSNFPVDVDGLGSGVTAIAAGFYHSLAIQGGDVYAWGWNQYGQLGNGGLGSSNVPLQVLDLEVDLIDVAAGTLSSYALSANGSLWVWGSNSNGQLGLGDDVDRLTPTQLFAPDGYRFTAIAAGAYHALAIIEPVAVPEPSTLALLALVGVVVALWRRG